MPTATQLLESSFTDQTSAAYLRLAPTPDAATLQAWRYRHVMPWLHKLHAPLTGLALRQQQVQGQRLVWLEGGNPEGEPLLLLHGFGACKENWLPLLPFLLRRYRLFLPDMPGWGQSEFRADSDYGLDAQVERLARWSESVLPEPVHLVGSSLGGATAGLLAARHPQLFRSLTLMNAAGVAGAQHTPFEQGLQAGKNGLIAANLLGVVRLLDATMASTLLPWLLAPLASHDLVSRYQVNQHLFRQLLQQPPASALPSYSAISVPTLILWGSDDQVIHPSCAATFNRLIPHARCHLLDGVGHMPMVEAPLATSRVLRRFWQAAAENQPLGRENLASASE